MIDVIYLMGGIGKRAKLGYPKQFVYLGGKPLFLHGIDKLLEFEDINNIIIATSDTERTIDSLSIFAKSSDWSMVNGLEIKNFFGENKNVILCENGDSRQDSVKKALQYIETDFVLISEAVRPFITKELIDKVISSKNDNVTPVSNMKATVISKDYGFAYNRDVIGEVQMPQKYRTSLLKEAYEKVDKLTNKKLSDFLLKESDGKVDKLTDKKLSDFTDDCHLLNQVLGISVKSIEGIEENIKVTTPLDIEIARAIYIYLNGGKDE